METDKREGLKEKLKRLKKGVLDKGNLKAFFVDMPKTMIRGGSPTKKEKAR